MSESSGPSWARRCWIPSTTFNTSNRFSSALAQPYYHTGVRTSYSVSDTVDVGFYLVNGWNNSTDNNTGKSVGWSIAVSPNDNFSISQGYLGGPELDGINSPWRHLFDTVISASVNDQVEVLINYDYGYDAEDLPYFERTAWQGIAGAVRFSTTDKKWAFSPRFEYFSDKDAFATGIAQDLKEITLTADYAARARISAPSSNTAMTGRTSPSSSRVPMNWSWTRVFS